jgi:hypothetical protein
VIDKDLLQAYPIKRIKPIDGLAVTADVWEEAHDYHRERQRYHDLLAHGYGIVAGLEVVASDPPDSSVYIMPGLAVDAHGNSVVLPQAVAYDLGAAQGALYLLLSYGESKPGVAREGSTDGARLYVYSEFDIQAVPALPAGPHIELARLRRSARAPIKDAKDAGHPQDNEIDQRFRRALAAQSVSSASMAVCYMGSVDHGHGRGADYMARAATQSGVLRACVDEVALSAGIDGYTLVHVTGQGAFQMSPDEMNALYAYVQAGGTLFIESSREGAKGEPAADAIFLDLFGSFGIQLEEIKPGHELLTVPHLFGAPPAGFETSGKLMAGGGVVFSTYDYGNLWQGAQRTGPASREAIRAAHEFGANLLAYAIKRRAQVKK